MGLIFSTIKPTNKNVSFSPAVFRQGRNLVTRVYAHQRPTSHGTNKASSGSISTSSVSLSSRERISRLGPRALIVAV